MAYSEITEAIEKLPMSQLPGVLVTVVETAIKKKCFKAGRISSFVGRIEYGKTPPEQSLTFKLSADSVRQYTDRIKQLEHGCLSLETQLEGVSSSLMIANRDLDAAKSDMLLHSKLRIELVTALGLDSLPPRGDNSRIFEAIEKRNSLKLKK